MSKDLVKEYVSGMKTVMQQRGRRLGGVPRMVLCSACYLINPGEMNCTKCANTRRAPIPWAEVMNVR